MLSESAACRETASVGAVQGLVRASRRTGHEDEVTVVAWAREYSIENHGEVRRDEEHRADPEH